MMKKDDCMQSKHESLDENLVMDFVKLQENTLKIHNVHNIYMMFK